MLDSLLAVIVPSPSDESLGRVLHVPAYVRAVTSPPEPARALLTLQTAVGIGR